MRIIDNIRIIKKSLEDIQEHKNRVFRLRNLLLRVLFQYRAFRLISPATIEEIRLECGEIDDAVRETLKLGGIDINELDTVPRSEYVALVAAYTRIASKFADSIPDEPTTETKWKDGSKIETGEDNGKQ